jgi:MFS family permease
VVDEHGQRIPQRSGLVNDIAAPEILTSAVAINNIVQACGRLLGPAVAGVLIAAIGLPPVFYINAVSYLVVFADAAPGPVASTLRPQARCPLARKPVRLTALRRYSTAPAGSPGDDGHHRALRLVNVRIIWLTFVALFGVTEVGAGLRHAHAAAGDRPQMPDVSQIIRSK